MRATHVSMFDLEMALAEVNKKYDNNICFHPESIGPKKFRLHAKESGVAGTKLHVNSYQMGWTKKPRKSRHACWHAHGHFFEELLKINPEAVIYTGYAKITAEGGNWQDWDIGSMMSPMYASESCNCNGRWDEELSA